MLLPSTAPGDWCATALFWRPQLPLLVNERTLLPALLRLAPASTQMQRVGPVVAQVLRLHRVGQDFVERELVAMAEVEVANTAYGSVVGTTNELEFQAEVYRDQRGMTDLLEHCDASGGEPVRRDQGQQPGAAAEGDVGRATALKQSRRAPFGVRRAGVIRLLPVSGGPRIAPSGRANAPGDGLLMLFDFWARLPAGETVHPEDRPVLDRHPGVFELGMPPGHISGPLRTAPVVACFLNPGFDDADAAMSVDPDDRRALFEQMGGESPFPLRFPGWARWYLPRVGRVALPPERLATTVATFNVCAYASRDAGRITERLIRGLPSAAAARRHLREVLLPQARRRERFVVVCRGAWAWGVDRSVECENVRFAPSPAGGHFGEEIGEAINRWLEERGRDVRRE